MKQFNQASKQEKGVVLSKKGCSLFGGVFLLGISNKVSLKKSMREVISGKRN